MSLFYPRSSTETSSSGRNQPPGFSSLFRMLDDFERYAQHHIGGNHFNLIGGPSSSTSNALTSGTSGGGGSIMSFAPKFDVTEHDKSYSLQGELPGVPPENVVLEFTDPQTLVVRGHVQREHTEGDPSMAPGATSSKEVNKEEKKEGGGKEAEEKGAKAKYWLSERSYGEFSRVFSFPAGVDQDKVEAKFDKGVLNITVPKAEKKGTRRIEIK